MLETMQDFFNERVDGYEKHQMSAIASADEFYPFTAEQLPMREGARVLDLGCGTGLELERYFELNPTARITCVDLAEKPLKVLQDKFLGKTLSVVQGSYFEVPFGEACFDAVLSVESLHHSTLQEKIPLYAKAYRALMPSGFVIITDYFAETEEEEARRRAELLRLKAELGLRDDEFYHYDTPLTAEHESDALFAAGFSHVEELGRWGATHCLKAIKTFP